MKKLEFSGKTLDDALEKAAEVFQTNKALIQYDVTISEKPGFFAKLFSRGVTIKAWMDDSSFDLAALTRQTVENSLRPSKKENRTADRKKTPLQKPAKKELQPRKTRDDHNTQESSTGTAPQAHWEQWEKFDDLHEGAFTLLKDTAKNFAKSFSIPPQHVSFKRTAENVVTVIFDDTFLEDSFLRNHKVSESFAHIYKRICYKVFGELHFGVKFEAPGASQDHEEKLKKLAYSLAERVKSTGKNFVLRSKTSLERKIIHTALEHNPHVGTESVGKGSQRKLIIFLKNHQNEKPPQKNKRNHDNRHHRQNPSPTII